MLDEASAEADQNFRICESCCAFSTQRGDADPEQAIDEIAKLLGESEVSNGSSEKKGGSSSEYRYGNMLLGAKGEFPEDPLICSNGHFNRLWKHSDDTRGITVRKWIPFAICNVCSTARRRLANTRDTHERDIVAAELRAHLRFVKRERMSYAMKRRQAIDNPRDFMSIIIDGADQSDHDLPHIYQKCKASSEATKLRMHVIGAIVHGSATYAYTSPAHVAQGHNVTIQALWDTMVHEKRKRGRLPGTLYLQLDNTTKQCKGRYLNGFLAVLVNAGVFKKVVVSFLPVGHTHEDIDQFFSRISVALRSNDALSRDQLAKVIEGAFRSKNGNRPVVRHWATIANISGWLEKVHLKACEHISFYNQVRIFTGTDGLVWLQARRWPGGGPDDHWGGVNKNHIRQPIFPADVIPDLLHDYDNVPIAPLSSNQPDEAVKTAMQDSLEKLYVELDMCEADIADCRELCRLYCHATEDDMRFTWDKGDMEFILRPPVRVGVESLLRSGDGYLTASDERVTTNSFYILRAADDGREPFILACARLLSRDDKENPIVHCQLWDLKAEDQLKRPIPWASGTYVPNAACLPHTRYVTPLSVLFYFALF